MADLTLMHYAAEPVALDRSRSYAQEEPHSFGKPHGLWVSVTGEDDWPSWVRGNMDETRVLHGHHVALREGSSVHVITDPFGIDAITHNYATRTEYDLKFPWRIDAREKWPIDWRAVAKDCDGIIIAPYQWSCRMDYDWYYGWDCASGCIWNLDAIESFEPAEVGV